MGLENLKSIFQEDLINNIESFSSKVITNVNDTKLTQFTTTELDKLIGQSPLEGMSWESLYNPNHSPKDNPSHKGLAPINYPNASRDNLNIRNSEDGRFGFAGSSRTSVISAVGKLIDQVPFLEGDVTEFLKDTGKEPYIVSNIGTGGRLINSNFGGRGLPVERALTDTARIGKFLTSPDGVLFIGKQNLLALQQIPFTTDLNRTQLFNAGARDFGAKFNMAYKSFYNPLSSLISTLGRAGGGPAGKISKTEPGLAGLVSSIPGLDAFGEAFDSPYPKFQTEHFAKGSQLANIIETGRFIDGIVSPKTLFESDLQTTDKNPKKDSKYGDGKDINVGLGISAPSSKQPYPKDLGLQSLNNTFTGDGNPVGGKSYPESDGTKPVGDRMTLASIIEGNTLDNLGGQTTGLNDEDNKLTFNVEDVNQGMPFYFKDLRDNKYIFFRAFIEGLNESISPSYNSTQYIGRSEPVYTYSQTEREINFTLKLFAQTKDELGKIYEKMNKLTSLCYPEYFTDEVTTLVEDEVTQTSSEVLKNVGYGNRMKAPLTKLRIGDMFGSSNSELQGYIKSLSYVVDEVSPWEISVGERVPKYVVASIGYQVIHATSPNLETKFYGYIGD